jgi:3-deoxy-7-phosphoheptulonate synthase
MALATNAAAISGGQTCRSPSFLPLRRHTIRAVHAAEPSKSVTAAAPKAPAPGKWAVDGWKAKKALQLPEYPNAAELEAVLKTVEAFPAIVFSGEARRLEERLAEAAVGRAFLLQGGDCAESFKEFHGNNIRDTFRVLLQMSAVLMFGGQMPVVKVFIFLKKKSKNFTRSSC